MLHTLARLAGPLVLTVPGLAQTIVFTDGDFTSWTSTVVHEVNGSTGLGAQDVTVGNPAPSWRVTHQVMPQGSINVLHEPTDLAAAFDPIQQGPFERAEISFDVDVVQATAFGSVVAFVLAAQQDGDLFFLQCSYELVSLSGGFATLTWSFTAPEFREYSGGPDRLDFANGGPIVFGFLTSNSSSGNGGTSETLIDNFDVTVHVGPSPLGTQYCQPPAANSIGSRSPMIATGSDVAGGNPLNLRATCLPTNEFGYFLVSQSQADIPNPGGSQGTLCLGGAIGRFNLQIANSGSAGEFDIDVDTLSLPMPTGPAAIQPGETWNFQCWYRDNNPGSTSNFTDGVSILFQ